MMSKFERILFYPVLVVATVLTLQSWTYQPVWISGLASVVVVSLWISPLAGKNSAFIQQALFWLTLCVLLSGVAWIFLLSR